MNSANRLRANKTRNIHNDQKPRRLARKFRSRRRISGVILMPSTRSARARARDGAGIALSTLDLSTLEIDPRISEDVHQVTDQIEDQADQREEVERSEHHRIVTVD